jgi:uncharacterized protein (TIGR00255 family)
VDLVGQHVSRGNVTGNVRVALTASARGQTVRVDTEVARGILSSLRRAAKTLGVKDDLQLSHVLSLPDVVTVEDLPGKTEQVWPILQDALRASLRGLVSMKQAEGKALERDLRARLGALERIRGCIQRLAPGVVTRYRAELQKRVRDAGVNLPGAAESLTREIVLFTDRSDISEELVRLSSHFVQFRKNLGLREPVGRALDFLCQEIFREITTIGSKANDAAISAQVVKFKALLEQMREQIQNVE